MLHLIATDKDLGENGEIRFRVSTGAVDQFVIDSDTGVIYVSNSSRGFDFDTRNRYEMKVGTFVISLGYR